MNLFKKSQYLLLVIAIFAFISCNESNAGIDKSSEVKFANPESQKQLSTQKQLTTQKPLAGISKVQAELDKAKKAKKAVFVVVTGNGVTTTAKATAIAKGALGIYKNAVIVEMNRDDAANSALVSEWRVSTAPLPLILVLSSKGTLTGGNTLDQATAENIAAFVPSPKLEQVYEAIAQSKNVVLAFTKKSFTDKSEVLLECNKAVTLLKNEAIFVEVDMDDPNETNFMKQLRINPQQAKSSVTLVINKQGQVAGQSSTVPDAGKLAAAAKTPVKSGCGPGCGPSGCGK